MDTGYDDRVGSSATRLHDRDGRPSMAALPVLIGSLILVVGAFLDWASTDGGEGTAAAGAAGATEFSGYNLPDGRIAAAIGVALLVSAALMWANKRVTSWFDADLLTVALSAIAITTIVLFLIDSGDAGRSTELGTYVSLAGAAIAFIGSLAALLRSGSDRATADREGRGDVGRRVAA